jgi:SOS-response transcriptional repressor LexA
VEGDSMAPAFPRGMLIYIDPEIPPTSGRKVVAMCDDTRSATFKQYFEDGGHKYLKAMNPNWPEPYTPLNASCHIIGTVVFAGSEV